MTNPPVWRDDKERTAYVFEIAQLRHKTALRNISRHENLDDESPLKLGDQLNLRRTKSDLYSAALAWRSARAEDA